MGPGDKSSTSGKFQNLDLGILLELNWIKRNLDAEMELCGANFTLDVTTGMRFSKGRTKLRLEISPKFNKAIKSDLILMYFYYLRIFQSFNNILTSFNNILNKKAEIDFITNKLIKRMNLKIHYEQRSIIKLTEHGNTSPDPVFGVFLGLDAHEHNEVCRVASSRQYTLSG